MPRPTRRGGVARTLPTAPPRRPWPQRSATSAWRPQGPGGPVARSAALPKSAHPGAKKHLAEIWNAEDKTHALAAVKAFEAAYGAKHPKAVAKVTDDLDELLAFYDYPAEHWIHLRTTNPMPIWSRLSRPSGTAPRSPKVPAPGPAAWPWPSSSSSPPRPGGGRSTHPTSSPSSAPGPAASSTATSSNAPTTDQQPPKNLIHKPLTIALLIENALVVCQTHLPDRHGIGPLSRGPCLRSRCAIRK